MTDTRDVLQEAFEQLTISDLSAYYGGERYELRKKYKCPLHREKSPSFNLVNDGRFFKCHGCGLSGGVWKFAEALFPGKTKGDIAQEIKTAFDPTYTDTGRPDFDPVKARAQAREKRRRQAAAREKQLASGKTLPALPPMSPLVQDRWDDGVNYLLAHPARQKKLAESRGWPVDWVVDLAELGLVGLPFERWHMPGEKGARRSVAFKVEQPAADGSRIAVGYHQRWTKPMGEGVYRHIWDFVPCVPKTAKNRFETHLQVDAKTIHAYPFIIGSQSPKLVIVLEGQWDAATMFYAGIGHCDPDVAVIGLRGSSGTDVFISAYGAWLKAHRPTMWLIPDNDTAGKTWTTPKRAGDVPFAGRLDRYMGLRTVISNLDAKGFTGKDLNDWHKQWPLDKTTIAKWRKGLGV